MKIIMRLYRQHDLDLIHLYKTRGFSFQKNMKSVLKAYINKEAYEVVLPDNIDVERHQRTCQFHICLSESEDAEIIDWLKGISYGYRNSLLKNLFRNYMSAPIVVPYFTNVQTAMDKNKEKIKSDKTPVSIDKDDIKNMVQDILNAPLADTNKKDVSLSEAEDVLKKQSENSKDQNSSETKPLPKNQNDRTNVSDVQNNHDDVPEDDQDDFDFFEEFDSMMGKI